MENRGSGAPGEEIRPRRPGSVLPQGPPQSDDRPPVAPSAEDPRQAQSRFLTANLLVVLACTLVSAGAAVWSGYEARRNNDFSQKDANSAVITETNPNRRDDQGCVIVENGSTLELTGTAKMAKGAVLWEITQGVNDSSLWPGPKAQMNPGASTWSMPKVGPFGGDGDQGHRYTVLLISVPPNGAGELDPQASAGAGDYKALKELPDETEIVAQLCVVRA